MINYYYREDDYIYIGGNIHAPDIKWFQSFGGRYNMQTRELYVSIYTYFSQKRRIDDFLSKRNYVNQKIDIRKKFVWEREDEIISLDELQNILNHKNLLRKPRDYQVKVLHYMLNHPGAINGMDCGLGKTGVTILHAEVMESFPVLIVCPATVKYNWAKEWLKWIPNRKIQVIESKDKVDDCADVYIINYDILGKADGKKVVYRSPEWLKLHYSMVFFDEIHYLKNSGSVRSKICRHVAKKALRAYGLTGTLAVNRPAEIINPLMIIDRFNDIWPDNKKNSGWGDFICRYCNGKKIDNRWEYRGARYIDELYEILTHYCYVRVEKRDVLKELPALIETEIDVELSNKKEYKLAESNLIEYLENIDIEQARRAELAKGLVRLNVLRKLSIEGKMKHLIKIISEWLESNEDEKLLVFGHRRDPLKKLHGLFPSFLIQGGLSSKKKQAIVESFRDSIDKRIIFANIESIGVGTDGLQECCSNILYIELPIKSVDLDQANSRLERLGQKKAINVTYAICPHSIDIDMMRVIDAKRKVVDGVNKGMSEVVSLLKRFKQK